MGYFQRRREIRRLQQALLGGDLRTVVAAVRHDDFHVSRAAKEMIEKISDPSLASQLEILLREHEALSYYQNAGILSVIASPLVRLRAKAVIPYLLREFRKDIGAPEKGFRPTGGPARDLAAVGYGAAPSLLRWTMEFVFACLPEGFMDDPAHRIAALQMRSCQEALAKCEKSTLTCEICSEEKNVSAAQATRLHLRRTSPNADLIVAGSMKSTQLCFDCGRFFCNDCLPQAFSKVLITECEQCPKCGGFCTFV